ncbi:MAG: hypothetical protein ACRDI0_02570 [Actinomycetota bacterium]
MSRRERNLLIVLGAVAVAAAAFFLLTRGGGAPEQAAPTPTTSPPPTVTTPPPGPPPDEKVPPRAFGFFGGRDPFVPLVVAEAGAGGAVTTPAEVEPEEPVQVPPTGAEEEEAESVVKGGERVQVVDVFVRKGREVVQVSVGGTLYVVGEGDTFARNFKVVAIDDPCATFLFGDEQFTLCEPGEKK